ncbi:hypothetical protein HPB47_026983 [Ixodes persulcatus]|uniref:Uncharacterized protein n=1 Tax=Ixodes persulcatus TaxID=34615 RepID=A0AC60PX56_IXOPE|nr:hypothetical protein HPB47_026983 [Ixodes persulcatus]
MDVTIRCFVRRWVNLPHDTPLALFHAPAAEGGLGITSRRASIPSMLLQRLGNLSLSDHPGCEAALRTPLLTSQQRRAAAATNFQDRDLTTKVEVHRMWPMLLHRSCDGKALKESRKVPAAHRWLTDGTRFLSGRQFINLVKLNNNVLPTLELTSGGRDRDISCRAGCQAPKSFGHMLQASHRGHRGRVKRHDNVAGYACGRLAQLQWQVLWEPHYAVSGTVMKTDLVAYKDADCVVLYA